MPSISFSTWKTFVLNKIFKQNLHFSRNPNPLFHNHNLFHFFQKMNVVIINTDLKIFFSFNNRTEIGNWKSRALWRFCKEIVLESAQFNYGKQQHMNWIEFEQKVLNLLFEKKKSLLNNLRCETYFSGSLIILKKILKRKSQKSVS